MKLNTTAYAKRKTLCYRAISLLFLLLSLHAVSQKSGLIVRTAAAPAGRTILDPNGDGYTSATTAGFNGDDVANSEIPYKTVSAIGTEPPADLRRGSSHNFPDFVPDANGAGFYTYFTGGNLLFRMRLGSISPGSSAFSVLLDTDGKFGATGTNADPNFQPETTGTNGNPGFEIEIALESNVRIAIYNVDGTSTPVLVKAYNNWQDMSQVSNAATGDNANPDFLLDFYIPFSDLMAAPFNLTSSSKLRMIAATVTASKAAIGGPKSDIYGLNDAGYTSINAEFEDYINSQPPFSVTDVAGNGPGIGSTCTPPPFVNGPISVGNVTVSGTWAKSSFTGSPTTTTITVYKNGVPVGAPIVNVVSGTTWSINLTGLTDGNIITASAQSTGESTCEMSNAVTVLSCNTSTRPDTTGLRFTCFNLRGMNGTMPNGNQVRLYRIDKATLDTARIAGPVGGSNAASDSFGYSSANTWFYNGKTNGGGTDPCSGGSPDITTGSYFVTTNVPGSACQSAPVFICNGGLTMTTAPTISPALYAGTTQVSGSAAANSKVFLWVNGRLIPAVNATAGGNYIFTGVPLIVGDRVEVRATSTGNCTSNAATATVSCYTNPPLITADNNNQLAVGAPVSGVSGDGAGTIVRVYTAAAVLVATTTVQADGTWSTGNAGTTPAPYNAVASTSYYATAQNGQCALSVNSGTIQAASPTLANRCGSITAPITAVAASVSGTLSSGVANTSVQLYEDGISIGTPATTSTTSWTISIPANTLYPGGILTIGVREQGKKEVTCITSVTVECASSPNAPIVSPTNSTIQRNQAATYTISNAVSGNFYGLADAGTGYSLGQGIWAPANGNLSMTTDAFTTPGAYTIQVKSTNLTGVTICSSPAAMVTLTVEDIPLPVHLTSFTAQAKDGYNLLEWTAENEENFDSYVIENGNNGTSFTSIGNVKAIADGLQHNYSFNDATPGSKTFYRLKLLDRDGHFEYSHVVVVNRSVHGLTIVISPNPGRDHFTLNITSEFPSTAIIQLTDAQGRMLRKEQTQINSGVNSFDVKTGVLPQGIYFIQVKTNRGERQVLQYAVIK
jgi:hypothetical protein